MLDPLIVSVNQLVEHALTEGSDGPSQALRDEAQALITSIGQSIANGYERGFNEGIAAARSEPVTS